MFLLLQEGSGLVSVCWFQWFYWMATSSFMSGLTHPNFRDQKVTRKNRKCFYAPLLTGLTGPEGGWGGLGGRGKGSKTHARILFVLL